MMFSKSNIRTSSAMLLLMLAIIVLSLFASQAQVSLANSGNILIKQLPSGGTTLVGTTDSADRSTIALAHSTKTQSFYTGLLEHPCALDTSIYGTQHDLESITKGQAMYFFWDEDKVDTVCKWMKAWPMHSAFLSILSARSQTKGATTDAVFVASRLSSDISTPTFDFDCADSARSVLDKGDSFVMKINGNTGQCLWIRSVPHWNTEMKGAFMSAVTRSPDSDQATFYLTNAAAVHDIKLDYGSGAEYTVSAASGNPESFVVALSGADGTAKWLRPLTVDNVVSAMPTALASY